MTPWSLAIGNITAVPKEPVGDTTCPVCGKLFYRTNSTQIYCPHGCQVKVKRERHDLRRKGLPVPPLPRMKEKCKWCGEELIGRQFCDQRHAQKYANQKRRGRLHA